MSTSRSYHHGDLRAALLETTRVLLAEVGIAGLSLREVSRQAGVSHAAAYNHFRDKAGLVRAVVDSAFTRLAAELRLARASTSDPTQALLRIGVAYVRFAYQNPADFKIMFRPEHFAVTQPTDVRTHDDGYAVLVDSIADCQAAGVIAPGAAEPLVLAAWSMVHGLSSLIVDGPDRLLAPTLAAAEARAWQCLETLAHGVIVAVPVQAPQRRRARRGPL